jgi:hypothetical protein
MWAMVSSYGRLGATASYTIVEADGAVKIDVTGVPKAEVQVKFAGRPAVPSEEDHSTRVEWRPPGLEDVFGRTGWAPFFSQPDHL